MEGVGFAFFWGVVLGAGTMWLLCCRGLLASHQRSAADDDVDATRDGNAKDGQDGSSAKREAVTVEGLAAALMHVSSSTDRVTVQRNRLSEIHGPLSGKDVITLHRPVTSRSDRMEVLRLVMPRVRGTVPDNEYERIMSMLSSGDTAEASELLRR